MADHLFVSVLVLSLWKLAMGDTDYECHFCSFEKPVSFVLVAADTDHLQQWYLCQQTIASYLCQKLVVVFDVCEAK